MNIIRNFSISIFTLLVINACSERLKDDGTPERTQNTEIYDVDSTFEPFIKTFIAEGNSRNKNIDIIHRGLKMKLVNMVEIPGAKGAAGITFTDSVPVVIYIDRENWNQYSQAYDGGNFEHSFVIFHELGHAFLHRQHYNKTLPNGDYASIMVGGDMAEGQLNRANFRGSRIKYYFDELFLPGTIIPAWANSPYNPFNDNLKSELIFLDTSLNSTNSLYENKYPIINGSNLFEHDINATNDVYYELIFGFVPTSDASTATVPNSITFDCNGFGNESGYFYYSRIKLLKSGYAELSTFPEGPLVQLQLINDSTTLNAKDVTDTLGFRLSGTNNYWYYNNKLIYFAENRYHYGNSARIATDGDAKAAYLVKYSAYYPKPLSSKSAIEMPDNRQISNTPKKFYGKTKYKPI
jgi:hypothetical protein